MIKAKDLIIGNLYITKGGVVFLYLGKSLSQKFIFYRVAHLCGYFDSDIKGHTYEIYYQDIQLNYVTQMIKAELQSKLDKRCIYGTKYLNGFLWNYPDLSFTQDEVKLWLQKNELLGLSLFKDLATLQGKEEVDLYVKSKDLIPGHVYYNGNGWRNMYVYLGRDDNKKFLWYFIGNTENMRRMSMLEMSLHCDKTVSNKKVKDVWTYKDDLTEDLCRDVIELGKEKFAKLV